MLHPSYSDLMSVVNLRMSKDEQLRSRYSIVIATSKRARQLIEGEVPLLDKPVIKPLTNAIWELYEGKIDIKSV